MSLPTQPYSPQQAGRRLSPDGVALIRELVSVLCMVLGAVGIVAAAFTFDPRAGLAAASALTLTVGVILGLDR